MAHSSPAVGGAGRYAEAVIAVNAPVAPWAPGPKDFDAALALRDGATGAERLKRLPESAGQKQVKRIEIKREA